MEARPAVPRPILRSRRLYLHPMEREALPASVAWFADPDFAEGFNVRAPLSLVEAESWFEDALKLQGTTRWDFDIRLRSDRRPIGLAGLMDVDASNGGAELLVGIGERPLRDQRYGTEVIGILLDFAFGELRLHRVQLRVWAFNERAIHVYERIGFHHEVRHRQGRFHHGRYHDVHYMSLLEDEWGAQDRRRMWEID